MSKVISSENKIRKVLEKGVEKIYPSKKALEKKLRSGKRIRLYCGFDPSAPNLHIGNAIQIRKLAQFQKLGHEVIFLIGDFTGRIGDPTGKLSARKQLNVKQIKVNLKNYKKQASKILSFSGKNPAKIKYNSKWNDKLKFSKLIKLASNFTVGQIIARDMFQKRIKQNKPIYLHEFLYPLAQAYDSVAMNVDLEIGGNDQTFNMLCGRQLIKDLKKKEKFVLTTKLLVDPLGKKMGKTEGNIISLNENPKEMYGKIMSWPDSLIIPGFELCTDLSLEKVQDLQKQIKNKEINPRKAKAKLAKEITSIHYTKTTAQKAEKEFNRIFREKKEPTKLREYKLKNITNIINVIIGAGLAQSKSEAKRLIKQGGVKVNGKVIKSWEDEVKIKQKSILQVGKRKFVKLI